MFHLDIFLLFHHPSSCFQLESIFTRKRIQIGFIGGSDRVEIGKPIRTLSQPYLNPISTLSQPRRKNGIRARLFDPKSPCIPVSLKAKKKTNQKYMIHKLICIIISQGQDCRLFNYLFQKKRSSWINKQKPEKGVYGGSFY